HGVRELANVHARGDVGDAGLELRAPQGRPGRGRGDLFRGQSLVVRLGRIQAGVHVVGVEQVGDYGVGPVPGDGRQPRAQSLLWSSLRVQVGVVNDVESRRQLLELRWGGGGEE